ncbi:glycosyltransferase family 2 protein [Vagococcus lutrae]|uniref:glycosyltransferase family 2 protein n=1 Tax=Vagococcus lutrae TaxID=81947 RepID=UPI000F891F9A|nr:glycosyltransferase family 2 protein [Vagococcus lutrae]RST93832.1 hypothetical protein CBF33_01030 [Vagococcus lutrae]
MYKKRVSIIVPHYNSVGKLKRLLKSIDLKKNDDLLEVIIVDDRSTEDISSIIEMVCEFTNLSLFFNEGIKGAGTCRNIGLKKAVGEWLVFADADDYFMPNYYKSLYNKINSAVDIIYFLSTSIDERTKELSDRHYVLNNLVLRYLDKPNKINETFLRINFIVPWSKMYRSDFIKANNIKFDEIIVSNDVMFSVKAGLTANKIATSEDLLYCVTRDSGTLTTSYQKDKFIIRIKTFLKYNEYISNNLDPYLYKKMNINGLHWLIESNYYNFSLSEKLRLIKTFMENKIPIVAVRQVNIENIKRNIKKILKTRQKR